MTQAQYELGMMGLGTMGRNLLLNMADHGFPVAGFDITEKQVVSLKKDAEGKNIGVYDDLKEFVASLKLPRKIMMLVPAGKPVDGAIASLLPLLSPGDIIIDGGNSHFVDTDRRVKELEAQKLHFIGVGVSGGEEGARRGPSIMPGGDKEAYKYVQPILEAVSAKVGAKSEPCVAYMGNGSAGHYVKMVHNGIEYGIMQLLAETYDVMKTMLGMDNAQIADTFSAWDNGDLSGFLVQISADIFRQKDDKSSGDLVDQIQDMAKQKGTGIWASEDSLQLRVPITIIDTAVALRDLSFFKDDRVALSKILKGPSPDALAGIDKTTMLKTLEHALKAAMILAYAQGMSLMQMASVTYKYELDMVSIAKIWRGGCIIRSTLLEPMAQAFAKDPGVSTLLKTPEFASLMSDLQTDLRTLVQTAAQAGLPIAAYMSALSYYDAYRRSRLPANLVQAQRDYFGAHTYERIDAEGVFHTAWSSTKQEKSHAAV